MESVPSNKPLRPSLLDRLMLSPDAPLARVDSQRLSELLESLRRDLENLLNTRRCVLTWPVEHTDLDRSVVNYGIRDFTGVELGSPSAKEQLRQVIERAIEQHETRLSNVRVVLIENAHHADRTLRFQIEARLVVEPFDRQPLTFQSSLEPVTSKCQVSHLDR